MWYSVLLNLVARSSTFDLSHIAVLKALGGEDGDEIAGFIYLGTASEAPSERARPELDDIVTFGLTN